MHENKNLQCSFEIAVGTLWPSAQMWAVSSFYWAAQHFL